MHSITRACNRLSKVQLWHQSYRFPMLLLAIFVVNAIYLQQSWMSLIQKRNQIIAVKVAQHRDNSRLDSVVMAEPALNPKINADVIISIISPGKNSEGRQKIRNTWQKWLESREDIKIRVLFFIPQTDHYTAQYDDEIVLDFQKNKSGIRPPYDGVAVLVIYDWLQHNCRFNLLLRLKDGVFLRTDLLVASLVQLKAEPNSTRMVWGFMSLLEPLGDHQYIDIQLLQRWMVYLPPHPLPDLFALSYDVMSLLVQHYRQDFLTYYSVEEVSLAVWLIGTNVTWKNDGRMSVSDCARRDSFGVIPRDWDKAVQNMEKCGHPCIGTC